MINYNSIGLNEYLQKIDAPITLRKSKVTGMNFDALYEVQGARVRTSSLKVVNFIQQTSLGTAVASMNNGESITLSTTIQPDPQFYQSKILGVPLVSVFEGTAAVGSLKIFPRPGAGVGIGDYRFFNGWDYFTTDGYNLPYQLTIENVSAGAVSLFFQIAWRYIQENAGTSTA